MRIFTNGTTGCFSDQWDIREVIGRTGSHLRQYFRGWVIVADNIHIVEDEAVRFLTTRRAFIPPGTYAVSAHVAPDGVILVNIEENR